MKQKTIILTALLLILLLPLSLLAVDRLLPAYYAESYYAELSPMLQRIQRSEGKRLIVLGNSDVAFGLDGAMLESLLEDQGLRYTVCPFGLYAAVGMSAMLSLTENELRQGDLVVLVVEPVSEALSSYFGATAFLKCAESDPGLLLRLNSFQQQSVLGNYIEYLQTRFSYYREGTAPVLRDVYAKSSFDSRCDLRYPRNGNQMPLGFDSSAMVSLADVQIDKAFIEQIQAYCRKAEQSGARVCLTFSPVNSAALRDHSPEAVWTFFQRVHAAFPCPIISDPNQYLMDSGWFYDSNFHLNSAGAAVRTAMLASDIAAFEGCFEPVRVPLPAMPPMAAVSLYADGDTDAFVFEALETGWIISGVTENGLSRETLTVPSEHEGRAVVGFTTDALSNASGLTRLILPSTIAAIPDGLFSGCPHLAALVFAPRTNLCRFTPETLRSMPALTIYVPEDDYPMYRDGYGCEQNEWERFLNRIETY